MALQKQIGIKFNLKKDWKALFLKDTWFEWKRPVERDEYVIKRFTLWNVFRWYFFQVVLKIVIGVLYPVLRLAYFYWNDIEEGQETKIVTGRYLMSNLPKVSWFRFGK